MSGSGWQDAGQQGGGPGAGPPPGGGTSLTAVASNPDYPVTAGLDAPLEVARWRVIGNYILAIPHLIVLYVLQIVANVMVFVAWIVILFTGDMPPGIGTFIAGVHRYQWRVLTYLLFLREPYPAFGVPSGYAEPGGDPGLVADYPTAALQPRGRPSAFRVDHPPGIVRNCAGHRPLLRFYRVLLRGPHHRRLAGWASQVRTRRAVLGRTSHLVVSLLTDRYPPFTLG